MSYDDGFLAGYRDEVRYCIETRGHGKRWRRGYEAGQAQAREDLELRSLTLPNFDGPPSTQPELLEVAG